MEAAKSGVPPSPPLCTDSTILGDVSCIKYWSVISYDVQDCNRVDQPAHRWPALRAASRAGNILLPPGVQEEVTASCHQSVPSPTPLSVPISIIINFQPNLCAGTSQTPQTCTTPAADWTWRTSSPDPTESTLKLIIAIFLHPRILFDFTATILRFKLINANTLVSNHN